MAAQVAGVLLADAGRLSAHAAWRTALAAALVGLGVRAPRAARALAALAFGAAAAHGLAARLEQAAAGPEAPLEATFEARVASLQRYPGALALELDRVRAVDGAALPARVLLRERSAPGAAPSGLAQALPGDRLRLRARLRPVEGRANPGLPDRAREAARRGIGAQARLVHPALAVRRPELEGWRPLAPLHRLRARAARRIAAAGAGGGLVRALALGDRGGLTAETRDAFRCLGLSHLLAVSGLHLVLVAVAAYRGARILVVRLPGAARTPDPRRRALAVALVCALGYAVLAGWGLPVRRAAAMLAGFALAALRRRPARRAAPLLAAAAAVLALDPAALFDPGAQLSFAATVGLVAARRPERTALEPPGVRRRLGARVADLLASSAAAGAATAPLAAAIFGSAAPWGVTANLVAIPWTAFVLLPLSLLAALAAGLAPDAPISAALLGLGAGLGAGTETALAAVAARVPAVAVAPPGPLALAAAACAALAVVRIAAPLARAAAATAFVAALTLVPARAIEPPPPRVVALDVGQGDATLVQGRRAALLVDAGVALPGGPDLGASVVVPALRALGVARLDALVVTHADLDHRGGVPAVLAALPVDRVWLPWGGRGDPDLAPVIEAARRAGARVEERGLGAAPLRLGDLLVRFAWPPPAPPEGAAADNARSLALHVTLAGHGVLLPGDLEAEAETALLARAALPPATVLKLPHHGSRTSSTPALLAAARGAVAIASAPRRGRFGMPHPEVVARARAAGYAVWWTGRDGAVLVALGPRPWVRGWR